MESTTVFGLPSKLKLSYHRVLLGRWLFFKYKYFWGVRRKGWCSSLQERALYIYTLRLCYNKKFILYI